MFILPFTYRNPNLDTCYLTLLQSYISVRGVPTGDCPMFRRFYVQKVLCLENNCSKGSMFRRFYIQKVLCSEGSMFRRSYIQKVLCSEGSMFRRSYIQIYSEGPIFRKFFVLHRKNVHLSVSGKLQCKITNHRLLF